MTPYEAPAGIDIKFLGRPSGTAWAAWLAQNPAPATIWEKRKIITPRLLLVHTNGASGQGTWRSAQNWAMAAPANTKPTYQVDMDGYGVKFLPSNREAIANYKASPFSLAIECADPGWGPGKPGGAARFADPQAETIAQIIAAESELWNFPIDYPTRWDGTGVAAHTEPFSYPYWTNSQGKPCPGPTRKIQLRDEIMPRARELRYGQHQPPTTEQPPVVTPPNQEDDMKIRILAPTDAGARFYAETTDAGVALNCRWTGNGNDPKVQRVLAAHRAAGATDLPCTVADLGNVFIEGPLPTGDSVEWSLAKFANPS